jgi:hypothetical protein
MGFEEVVGFGQEATYGVAATERTPGWAKPLSFTLKNTDPPMMLGGPSGGSVPFVYNATVPRHYRGTQQVAGNITIECDYEMLGVLLANAVGAGTVVADDDIDGAPDVGTQLHTFNVLGSSASAVTPKSLTIFRINGVEDLVFTGCMVNTLEIVAAAESIVTVSMEIIGQAGGNALSAATDGTGYSAAPFIEFQDTCVRFDPGAVSTAYSAMSGNALSGAAAPLSWSLKIENNLRAVAAACSTTGRTIREPNYGGYRTVSLTIDRDFSDDTFFDEMFPATEAASYSTYEVRCTSTTAVPGGAGAYHALSLYIPAGIVMGAPNEYGGGADIESEQVIVQAAAPSAAAIPFTARLANSETIAYG